MDIETHVASITAKAVARINTPERIRHLIIGDSSLSLGKPSFSKYASKHNCMFIKKLNIEHFLIPVVKYCQ